MQAAHQTREGSGWAGKHVSGQAGSRAKVSSTEASRRRCCALGRAAGRPWGLPRGGAAAPPRLPPGRGQAAAHRRGWCFSFFGVQLALLSCTAAGVAVPWSSSRGLRSASRMSRAGFRFRARVQVEEAAEGQPEPSRPRAPGGRGRSRPHAARRRALLPGPSGCVQSRQLTPSWPEQEPFSSRRRPLGPTSMRRWRQRRGHDAAGAAAAGRRRRRRGDLAQADRGLAFGSVAQSACWPRRRQSTGCRRPCSRQRRTVCALAPQAAEHRVPPALLSAASHSVRVGPTGGRAQGAAGLALGSVAQCARWPRRRQSTGCRRPCSRQRRTVCALAPQAAEHRVPPGRS
jgi:hypothetical protein